MQWSDLANTKVGEVEKPKLIPEGHYVGNITGAPKVGNVGQKQNLAAQYPVRLSEPLDDVDAEAFAESSGFSQQGYNFTFWLTPDALWRFTDFGKALNASDEMSVPEMAEMIATSGEPIVFKVTQGTSKKGAPIVNLDEAIPLSLYQEQQAAEQQGG